MNANRKSNKRSGTKPKQSRSKPKSKSNLANQIYRYTSFTSSPGGVSSISNTITVQESFWEIAPKLSDIPGYAAKAAIYDKFRITKVEVEIIPTAQLGTNVSSAASARGCYLLTIIDHDDISTPASLNEMRQYANCKLHGNMVLVKRAFKPAVLTQTYETNVATGYSPKFDTWLSTTDSGTQHFGLKIGMYVVDASIATNALIFIVGAKYWFEFKDAK